MAIQVQKSRKVCGTCAYWAGIVRPLNNSYVSVETKPYDRCTCLSNNSSRRNQSLDYQGFCSNWQAKY